MGQGSEKLRDLSLEDLRMHPEIIFLIEQVFEVSEPTFMFRVLAIVYGSELGYLLFGFLLSTLLLKFISFAQPR